MVLFLLGIGLALLLGLFGFGSRLMSRGGKRIDVSRTVVGLSRELKTFAGCPVNQVSAYYPSGDPAMGDLMVSFPNYRRDDGTRGSDPVSGLPLVQSFEVYYRDSGDLLKHVRLVVTPSPAPLVPGPTQLQAVFDSNLGKERLARCRAFQLVNRDTGQPTAAVTGLTEIHIEVESTDQQWVKLDTHLRFLP